MKNQEEKLRNAVKKYAEEVSTEPHMVAAFQLGYHQAIEDSPCFSKQDVLNILEKRLHDAFANQFHRHEDARLRDAIDAIDALVPPECFVKDGRQALENSGLDSPLHEVKTGDVMTAKEFFRMCLFPSGAITKEEFDLYYESQETFKEHIQWSIEYAKMIKNAALKAAAEKAEVWRHSVDEDSILNAYPDELIK